MNKRKLNGSVTIYTQRNIRVLNDEEIAHVQVAWLDLGYTQKSLADLHDVSPAVICAVCRAIPQEIRNQKRNEHGRLKSKFKVKR